MLVFPHALGTPGSIAQIFPQLTMGIHIFKQNISPRECGQSAIQMAFLLGKGLGFRV